MDLSLNSMRYIFYRTLWGEVKFTNDVSLTDWQISNIYLTLSEIESTLHSQMMGDLSK